MAFRFVIRVSKPMANGKTSATLLVFGHDANGIDTGDFGGPMEDGKKPRASIPGHPLGLQESMLPTDEGNLQWLDPQSFAAGDQVIPLVNFGVGKRTASGGGTYSPSWRRFSRRAGCMDGTGCERFG